MTLYTGPTPADLARIPAALTARPQWVLWRGVDRLDVTTGVVKVTKIPIDPRTLANADTTDARTWGSYEFTVAALPVALEEWHDTAPETYRGGGIGYVFSHDDPFVGVDLDGCRDPDTGALTAEALNHIECLASYTEVSQSGTGVHSILEGVLPPSGRRRGAAEMYSTARFFVVTGWHVNTTPSTIEPRQDALTAFHARIFGPPQAPRPPRTDQAAPLLLEDVAVLTKARRAANKAKFAQLWAGDTTGHSSPSEADMGLCAMLAFWTQDPAQIDRLFRQSGLMRDKWDERRGELTYGQRTVSETLARQTEHYRPRRNGQHQTGSTADHHAGQAPPEAEEQPSQQTLLDRLQTLADDAREEAILEVLPLLAGLDSIPWMRLKRQLKAAVPRLNLNDLERARKELRRAQAAPPPSQNTTLQAAGGAGVALLLTNEGQARAVLANVLSVLETDTRWQGVLAYNELADETSFLARPPYLHGPEPWTPRAVRDEDDAETANWMQWQYGIFAATGVVAEGVRTIARRRPYHPIRAYLAGLTWDHTARLDTWLVAYCRAEDTPYIRAVGAKTLIGAVARVQEPGCKLDTATILEGEQGVLKSTVWRALASDVWFSDTLPDLHDKDAMQALRGKWIVELGDLAALHRSEVETIKRFLSANQDHYRPSYGRRAATYPRQNIFVGSTNKDEYFKDETGNRRFWPVATQGTYAVDALVRDRDQLWAEALVRYRQGEPWHLSQALEQLAAQEQAQRVEHDPWEAGVMAYAEARAGSAHVTTKDIMCMGLLIDNPAHWSQSNSKRVAAILHRHGWRRSRPKGAAGKSYAAFFKPLATVQQPSTGSTGAHDPSTARESAASPPPTRLSTDSTRSTDHLYTSSPPKRETLREHARSGCPSSASGNPRVEAVEQVDNRTTTEGNGIMSSGRIGRQVDSSGRAPAPPTVVAPPPADSSPARDPEADGRVCPQCHQRAEWLRLPDVDKCSLCGARVAKEVAREGTAMPTPTATADLPAHISAMLESMYPGRPVTIHTDVPRGADHEQGV